MPKRKFELKNQICGRKLRSNEELLFAAICDIIIIEKRKGENNLKTVYQTLDGEIYAELADATAHEEQVKEQVSMWDWEKNRTINTAQARLIHLTGDNAGALLRKMQKANPEEYSITPEDEIDDEDNGWFYYDEYAEQYRYIDPDIIDLLIAANHEI